jgi:hypothetical protein
VFELVDLHLREVRVENGGLRLLDSRVREDCSFFACACAEARAWATSCSTSAFALSCAVAARVSASFARDASLAN